MPKLNLKFNKLNTEQVVNNPINDPTESVNLDQLREPRPATAHPQHVVCILQLYYLAVDNPIVC